jgi:hypothetical protein
MILDQVPSLRELAERLARVKRWNGWTTVDWSVLQHSILTAYLLPGSATPANRLAALFHDAAEAYIGDIPRSFKVPEQRNFEEDLLSDLYDGVLGVLPPSRFGSDKIMLTAADDLAALAEAEVISHPVKRRGVRASHGIAYGEPEELDDAIGLVWEMLSMSRRDAVNLWTSMVEDLVVQAKDDGVRV